MRASLLARPCPGPMPPPRSRASSRPPPAHPKGPGQSTSRDGGASPTATARRAGAETRAPRKHPPSPPVPCRHSRPARPFATGATIGRARPAIGWFPHGRRDRSHDRRPPAIAAPPAAGEPRLQSRCSAFGTFVAARRRGDFVGLSHVRTHAQSRADLESPRARDPLYGRMRILSCDRAARPCASQILEAFPGAYGRHRSRAEAPRRTSSTKSPASPADRRWDTELVVAVTSVADTGRHALRNPSHLRTSAQSTRGHRMPSARQNPNVGRIDPLVALHRAATCIRRASRVIGSCCEYGVLLGVRNDANGVCPACA